METELERKFSKLFMARGALDPRNMVCNEGIHSQIYCRSACAHLFRLGSTPTGNTESPIPSTDMLEVKGNQKTRKKPRLRYALKTLATYSLMLNNWLLLKPFQYKLLDYLCFSSMYPLTC